MSCGACVPVQFITQYQHASGAYRIRATTVSGMWHNDPNDLSPVARCVRQSVGPNTTTTTEHRTSQALLSARVRCCREHEGLGSLASMMPNTWCVLCGVLIGGVCRSFDQEAAAVLMTRIAVWRTGQPFTLHPLFKPHPPPRPVGVCGSSSLGL
jgi:hypothetical protein